MKTFKLMCSVLSLMAVVMLSNSCQKDEAPTIDNVDNLVGSWSVAEGNATIFLSGIKAEVEIETDGKMTFREDGTGSTDFTMTFDGETERVRGTFTWERDGFEIVIEAGDEVNRWALVDDEPTFKTVQYTEDIEDGEAEFTFKLVRN